ncbi:hypothetical protein GJ496_001880 [Pomphorhynchus laevis]|nr:hypothetical protein GJ496_001880 [Pomphorhynchus laevis]
MDQFCRDKNHGDRYYWTNYFSWMPHIECFSDIFPEHRDNFINEMQICEPNLLISDDDSMNAENPLSNKKEIKSQDIQFTVDDNMLEFLKISRKFKKEQHQIMEKQQAQLQHDQSLLLIKPDYGTYQTAISLIEQNLNRKFMTELSKRKHIPFWPVPETMEIVLK